MAKRNLLGDTIIRRDGIGRLYLMNRQEGGWKSSRVSVASEEALLDEYNVRLGEWTRDKCSEYCPVICIPRSEQPTLHDGEEPPFVLHDIGPRGQVGDSELEAFQTLMKHYGQRGPNMMDDSLHPVVVGDGITQEKIRELARGRAGYSTTLNFGARGITPEIQDEPTSSGVESDDPARALLKEKKP
jgi:hypothetical protein